MLGFKLNYVSKRAPGGQVNLKTNVNPWTVTTMMVSTVADDALVLHHQAITIHNTDNTQLSEQFHRNYYFNLSTESIIQC